MLDKIDTVVRGLVVRESGSDAEEPPTEQEARIEPGSEAGSSPNVLTETAPESVNKTLLTDEERIVLAFEEHSVRMWQGDIASETEFSDSKTSRLLSSMEDDGMIWRKQVGRKKVVALTDEVRDAAGQ